MTKGHDHINTLTRLMTFFYIGQDFEGTGETSLGGAGMSIIHIV